MPRIGESIIGALSSFAPRKNASFAERKATVVDSPIPSSLRAMALVACLSLFSVPRLDAAAVARDCILTNHVGFVPWCAKFFVVLNPPAKEFSVFKGWWSDHVVYRGQLKHVDAELGDGWVGDFSAVREEDTYRIECGGLRSRIVFISRDAPISRCGYCSTIFPPNAAATALRAGTRPATPTTPGGSIRANMSTWPAAGTSHPTCGSGCSERRLAWWGSRSSACSSIRDGIAGKSPTNCAWGNRYFHNMVRPDGGLMDHIVVPVRWEKRDVYPNDPPFCATYLTIVGEALAGRYLADKDPEHSRKCLDVAQKVWRYATDPSSPPGPYQPKAVPKHHDWLVGFFDNYYRGSAGTGRRPLRRHQAPRGDAQRGFPGPGVFVGE